jgi:hypothetical protein
MMAFSDFETAAFFSRGVPNSSPKSILIDTHRPFVGRVDLIGEQHTHHLVWLGLNL